MKKQTKIIICSVAVLLLVVGCILGFSLNFSKKASNEIALFECLPSEILSYSVDRGSEGNYKLIREKDGWKVEGNDAAVIDQEKAEALIRCASKISAIGRVKEVSPSDLVANVKSVKIGLPDGEVVTLEFFGKDAKECMFKISGDDTVYTMYTSIRDILAEPLDTLRILDVFTGFDDDENMPEFYEYTDYDKETVSIRLKNGSELAQDDKNSFMMTKPYYRSADNEKFIQQIVVKIPDITREGSYVDDNPENPQDYGLDKESRASLTVGRDNVKHTLYLGKAENGMVYAQMSGQNGVFAIKSSQLEFLNTEPFFLIDSRLLGNGFEEVNRMYISVSGNSYDLRRNRMADGSEWFGLNGKSMTKDAFEEITRLLGEVELVSELMSVPQNTGDVVIKVQSAGTGKRADFTLVSAGEKEYAVFVNGMAQFAVEKQKINDIIDKIKE